MQEPGKATISRMVLPAAPNNETMLKHTPYLVYLYIYCLIVTNDEHVFELFD